MLLARTGQNTVALGSVESAASIGMVIGGIGMSAWGGFKKRVHGVLSGWMISSIFGSILFGMGRGLPVWVPTILISGLFLPRQQCRLE